MDKIINKLMYIGLTKAQSIIYYTLLVLTKATVKQISEKSGFHRTNIYDILDELKERGLVTYYKDGKSTTYSSVNPNNLEILINEKKAILDSLLPNLDELFKEPQDDVKVQVYKGSQGMKSAFNRMIRRKNLTLYGLNIKGQLMKELPIYSKQFVLKCKENNIKYKGIYTETYKAPLKNWDIRFIDKKFITPVATTIYDNTVLIQIWNPVMVAIEIQSKTVYEAYKNYFNLIWEGLEEEKKKEIKEKK